MASAEAQPVAFSGLSPGDQQLLRSARQALEHSYSPYSRFQVAAAVLTNDGKIVVATNVENAAYADSLCAERCAFARANAQGWGSTCVMIAIVTRKGEVPTTEVSSPCGSCRQVMQEFAHRSGVQGSFRIISATTNFDKVVVWSLTELLPHAFGPRDIEEKPS